MHARFYSTEEFLETSLEKTYMILGRCSKVVYILNIFYHKLLMEKICGKFRGKWHVWIADRGVGLVKWFVGENEILNSVSKNYKCYERLLLYVQYFCGLNKAMLFERLTLYLEMLNRCCEIGSLNVI